MAAVLIGLILVLILIIIAIRVGIDKEDTTEQAFDSQIHVSGIYSVIRKSPRGALEMIRPAEEDLGKYLTGINEDICELPITDSDRQKILKAWKACSDSNIEAIEEGDRTGVEFYYYDFPSECPGCKGYVKRGQYVSREEIFRHPSIIPPFHLGCVCMMMPHTGMENLRETKETGLRPFFNKGSVPALPEWSSTVKIS